MQKIVDLQCQLLCAALMRVVMHLHSNTRMTLLLTLRRKLTITMHGAGRKASP